MNKTTFSFKLNSGTMYQINIFDVSGRKIRTIQGRATGNEQMITWDLKDVSGLKVGSGVYLYRFESKETTSSGKIVILVDFLSFFIIII
ncbi:MAG: T9SS type A sorting domain-containing protein [bacterium]